MNKRSLSKLLKEMVGEDVGLGDITASFTPDILVKARITAKDDGFVSGIAELELLFKIYGIKSRVYVADGDKVSFGDQIFLLEGRARKILVVERTALNILSRMSGITTLTKEFIAELAPIDSKVRVTATRKTTPLFRYFEKKAVVVGGGLMHRMGLYDMVMIKDNHLKVFKDDVRKALEAAKKANIKSKIEVEATHMDDAIQAARSGADVVMLDNMAPKMIPPIIKELKKLGLRDNVLIEVSGGINLKNIGRYARLGIDWISIGKLTHSATALDYSLNIID